MIHATGMPRDRCSQHFEFIIGQIDMRGTKAFGEHHRSRAVVRITAVRVPATVVKKRKVLDDPRIRTGRARQLKAIPAHPRQ